MGPKHWFSISKLQPNEISILKLARKIKKKNYPRQGRINKFAQILLFPCL